MASLTLCQTIKPTGCDKFDKLGGGPCAAIEDRAFNSRCPPVVTPDTIILAVCGPNDWNDNAGPDRDGGYVGDFYLFRHLFRGTAEQQHWMTCMDPKDLVEKYSEYAHGDPRSEDRRVVLDGSMIDDVKDVLVFQGDELLEKFLSYVAAASEQVKNSHRPILILMFGYGAQGIFSMTIGGTGEFHTCPKLTNLKFNEALLRYNHNPNVAVLTTSCYGESWIQSSYLNITAMASVKEVEELLSWPESILIHQSCDSRYARGVTKALIEREIPDLDLNSDEGVEVVSSSTFVALEAAIREALAREVDDVRKSDSFSFSVQGDVWNKEWREESGFPLITYQEKWLSLRLLGKDEPTDTNPLRVQADFRLNRLAYEYMNSKPSPDAAAKNYRVHGHCTRLLGGGELSDLEHEMLAGSLKYRLETIMGQATEYKDCLEELSCPDSRDTDPFMWMGKFGGYPRNEQAARFSRIYHMVSGWDEERINETLDNLVRLHAQRSKYHRTVRALRLGKDPHLQYLLETIQVKGRDMNQ